YDDGCIRQPPTSMILWLDADDGASLQGANAKISSWSDKRGGTTATFNAPTEASRPLWMVGGLNGRSVLRFDGTDDHLVSTFPQAFNVLEDTAAYTIFVVGFAKGSAQALLSGTHNNLHGLLLQSEG